MDHLRHSNDPQRRYIVNFDRAPLYGQGRGHHSPIGGYLEREDLAFVMDTNESYKPFLVDPRAALRGREHRRLHERKASGRTPH
jgi:hypothetical protein